MQHQYFYVNPESLVNPYTKELFLYAQRYVDRDLA
jgi:hypothetical protein